MPKFKFQKLNFQISYLKIILLVGIIAFAFWLGKTAQESDFIKHLVSQFGYVGLFITSVANGFNVVVPLPTISFLPVFLEAGMSLVIVILIISVGMTLADSVSFLIGKTGRQLVNFETKKVLKSLEGWRRRNHHLPLIILLLFASFAPAPNEVLLLPMGFLGYRKREVLPIVLVGNLIFNVTFALGIFGLFKIL